MLEDLSLSVNFISRETFQSLLLSCHFAVMFKIDFGEKFFVSCLSTWHCWL